MSMKRTYKWLFFIFILIVIVTGAQTITEIIERNSCEIVVHNKIYLAVGEEYKLGSKGYKSADGNVALVVQDVLKARNIGSTYVTKGCDTYEFEVTDLITVPYISEEKPELPCGMYSEEDNEYLDKILKSKIDLAGYQTRAGAVAAGRFLLLQFPYHMSYFSENGRMPSVDGEGRYYHEGLYLNIYKVEKENITKSVSGPLPWGCAMYSYPALMNQRNSLDCSGFVTWCLVNGGFDPGDIGAGPSSSAFDCSDLGERMPITNESLDKVKVGDLFAEDGHISILIGIKDGYYYIAESNSYIDIRVRVSTKQELIDSDFYAWIDMEEFYNHEDGNLTNYWE